MALPDDYLGYKWRRYGMDHERYDWSMLHTRKPVRWPGDARIALWISVGLQWFPLNMAGKPFKPPGAMQTAYPDLRHYTLRDYGNRVGIYRFFEMFDVLKLKASTPTNAAVATRYPMLIHDAVGQGWEIVGHGLDMDHLHYSGLAEDDERKLVQESLATLRRVSGQKVRGWLSPAKSESWNTPDLVAAEGIEYLCDWVNDDMPYAFKTKAGVIHNLPHAVDLDDYTVLVNNHHSDESFAGQIRDQFDTLYAESAEQGGRILALTLHPWVTGQPYRIKALRGALEYMLGHQGVWNATGGEILDAFKAQA